MFHFSMRPHVGKGDLPGEGPKRHAGAMQVNFIGVCKYNTRGTHIPSFCVVVITVLNQRRNAFALACLLFVFSLGYAPS